MAEPAQKREMDPASPKLVDSQLVISLTSEFRAEIEDYRFANRYSSMSAAVRHLIELGLRTAAWEAKKPK